MPTCAKLIFFRSQIMKASHEWLWSNADMIQSAQKRYHFYQENNRARWPKISDNILDLESKGSVSKSGRTLLVQPNFPSPAAGISAPTFSIHSTTYNNRVLCRTASADIPFKSEILIILNCQQPSYVFFMRLKMRNWENCRHVTLIFQAMQGCI
jgi:hypothetical protein